MGVPGDIPNAALESAGEIVRFHRDHRAVYTDLGPGARVGLVRPDRLAQDLARHEQSTQEFRGFTPPCSRRTSPSTCCRPRASPR